jgi:hypothetical protein
MSRSSPNHGFWLEAACIALALGALPVACAGADPEEEVDDTAMDNLGSGVPSGGASQGPPRAPTVTGASGGPGAQPTAASGTGGVRGNAGGAGGAPARGGSGGSANRGGAATAGRGGSAMSGGDGGSAMSSSDAGSGGEPPQGSLSFAEDVHPILVARCGSCHATNLFLPRFANSDVQAAYDVAADLSDTIVDVLDAGEMPPACGGPPGGNGCVSQAEFELIEAWVAAGSPE